MDGIANKLKQMRPVPVVPSSGLYLARNGETDERRFSGLFRDAWRRVPLGDRRLLLRHWRSGPLSPTRFSPLPRIALDVTAVQRGEPLDGPASSRDRAARCGRLGHELLFHPGAVGRATDAGVVTLVACALSHAYLHAVGDGSAGAEREVRADRVLRRWGFLTSEMGDRHPVSGDEPASGGGPGSEPRATATPDRYPHDLTRAGRGMAKPEQPRRRARRATEPEDAGAPAPRVSVKKKAFPGTVSRRARKWAEDDLVAAALAVPQDVKALEFARAYGL